MAVSIVETLEASDGIDTEALAQRFARRHHIDPARGYGGAAHEVLDRGRGRRCRRVRRRA
jgi:hypothetical protein